MFAIAKSAPGAFLKAAAVASAIFTAACEPVSLGESGPASGQQIDPSKPVPVALLVPGGTGNAEFDRLGRSLANSAKLAVSDARGAKIDLQIYNTLPTEGSAVAKANEAVANGAKIIVGPLFSDASNAVGNAVKDKNINVLSFSNNADIAGGNVFVLGNTFANVADRLVSYGVKRGKRNILMVAEDDVAGQVGAHAIERAIAMNGARLAGKVTHPVSQSGIDGIIPTVTAAAKAGRADAIFMTANQGEVLPYLTGKLADNGVTSTTTQMLGLTRWDLPATRLKLPGVQGGWFAIPDTRLQGQFESRYRAAYGETPHELGSLAYDGVAAIAALVRSGNKNALTTSGLTRSSGFAGINGVFRLRRDGTNQRGMAVATIENGKVAILDPAPQSFGGFGF